MKFDDSIWVISTVKSREKKRKEKVTYWGWGVVVGDKGSTSQAEQLKRVVIRVE